MEYLERTIVDLGSCYEMIITNVIRIAGHNWFRLMMLSARTWYGISYLHRFLSMNYLKTVRDSDLAIVLGGSLRLTGILNVLHNYGSPLIHQ